jgi:hypothetical protein
MSYSIFRLIVALAGLGCAVIILLGCEQQAAPACAKTVKTYSAYSRGMGETCL